MDKLASAIQSQADEARERAVWESYAQSLQLKLDQSEDTVKIVKEERDGLLEVVKDIRQSRSALEEHLAKLQEQVDTIPKLKEEVSILKAERDSAVEDKYKQLNELGATTSDSQKQIAALQDELAKLRASHDTEKKNFQSQNAKLQKEKAESDTKNTQNTKSLRAEIEKLEQQFSQQAPEIEKLRSQVKQAETREQELSKQVEGLRAQHKQAVKDFDTKSQEVTRLKREKQEADEKAQKQAKIFLKQETESTSKDLKVVEAQRQSADSQKQVADLQKQVAELKKQLDAAIAENAKPLKKSTESVAAQSPPSAPATSLAEAVAQAAAASKQANADIDSLKRQLEKEKKAHQDSKKILDAKIEEVEKLKKTKAVSVDEAESANKKKTSTSPQQPSAAPATTPIKKGRAGTSPTPVTQPPPTAATSGGINVEEDLKQHLFTWLTLALKFDRMAMRRVCNINASILYEKIVDLKVHYADWPGFIRAEMDKCTVDM